ncbi:MAG TPA: hypothetical protein VMT11_09005 [Myxococcaceae bacterium]|nr:hypothetical protein [Myxococcaceae bacterium]
MHSEQASTIGPRAGVGFKERDLELLWYRLASLRWRALALVAPGRPELASRLLQRLLDAVGGPSRAVRGVDASQATPGRIRAISRALERAAPRDSRERVLVAVPSPAELPEARDLVAACDHALLVLLLDESRLVEVDRTLALIDRARVLGAVLARSFRAS